MEPSQTIDELFREGKPIDDAAREGVRQALLRHKRLGESIVACVNGKGVIIPADQIEVSEATSCRSGSAPAADAT